MNIISKLSHIPRQPKLHLQLAQVRHMRMFCPSSLVLEIVSTRKWFWSSLAPEAFTNGLSSLSCSSQTLWTLPLYHSWLHQMNHYISIGQWLDQINGSYSILFISSHICRGPRTYQTLNVVALIQELVPSWTKTQERKSSLSFRIRGWAVIGKQSTM